MQKGKFGICLWFYAALAFVLAFLGQVVLCALLLGFVIAAEKNEWVIKQTMQALFLSLFSAVVSAVLSIFDVFDSIWFFRSVVSVIVSVIMGIVSLLILIGVIVALVRVTKDKDANLPLLSKLANRAFGILEQKVYTQAPPAAPGYGQPPYAAPQQPVYTQPQAPAAPQQPAQQAPAYPQQPQNPQNPQ